MSDDIASISLKQKNASSYEEWLEASEALDYHLGFDNWKNKERSQIYNFELIKHRRDELRAARKAKDTSRILYLVRTTLMRNIGNILSEQLYQNSYCGTKKLIEEYIAECKSAISELVACNDTDNTSVMNTLIQTRKAYGRTALVLSGGATLGLLHAGVLFELDQRKLLPKIISGSSAGSIFAALVCTHKDDEFDELWPILDQDLEIFERIGEEESVFVRLRRFLISGTFLDNAYLTDMLQSMLGDVTFQEAYNRTGRILNVTVSSSGMHDVPRLLNYLTAPNVLIWSAVASSCSVPFIFPGGTLMAKDPVTGEKYSWTKATFIDGSVDNDLPLNRLAEMFNVNHFIACQVNPHVAPALHLTERWLSVSPAKAPDALKEGRDDMEFVPDDSHHLPRWFRWGKSLLINEFGHYLDLLDQVGLKKNITAKLANLMDQEYIGNVTIIPRLELGDFVSLLKNPTPKIMHKALIRGRQATWPKIATIHNNCAIEMALDDAVHTLRGRVIGSALTTTTSSRKPKQMTRRRSEDGTARLASRWSSTDLTTSPSRHLMRQASIQSGKVAGIRHSMSLNANLNDLLQDASMHVTRNGRKHRSANHSPSLSRNDSFNNSWVPSSYSSPVTSSRYLKSNYVESDLMRAYRKSSEPSPEISEVEVVDDNEDVITSASDTETIRPDSPSKSISPPKVL